MCKFPEDNISFGLSHLALYQLAGREASDDARRSGPLLDKILYKKILETSIKNLGSSKGPDLLGSSEASRSAGRYNAKFDKD